MALHTLKNKHAFKNNKHANKLWVKQEQKGSSWGEFREGQTQVGQGQCFIKRISCISDSEGGR